METLPDSAVAIDTELFRRLHQIGARHARAALASSLGAEDMVLLDAIARSGAKIDVFVIDTGRLHEETLQLLDVARARYGRPIRVYRPLEAPVADFVRQHDLNGFYDGVAERHLCCGIRKVEPLGRALEGRDAWLTGQRRAQGPERASLPLEEIDLDRGIAKHNPLADWSDEAVQAYIERHDVPVNALHARGYPSIGCEPCTRAVKPGEDPRAGRWWWERGTAKECGLHLPKIVVEQAGAR
ncbi:MAG: phosphoadenylyl-sulfate reductase [Burkholderiales bacterium]|nr:phosphoadenylyl-sulfate reductase [Burkholderiales bacterium]